MASFHDFSVKDITGSAVALSEYKGRVCLVVNVASACGLTTQYGGLQKLHERYGDKGLSVLGFPCNQFGAQEPGTESEIQTFCETKYAVKFPMFSKIDVNGDGKHPVYEFLTSESTEPDGPGDIGWNFAKFLVDKEGNVVHRFGPQTEPESDEIIGAIDKLLA